MLFPLTSMLWRGFLEARRQRRRFKEDYRQRTLEDFYELRNFSLVPYHQRIRGGPWQGLKRRFFRLGKRDRSLLSDFLRSLSPRNRGRIPLGGFFGGLLFLAPTIHLSRALLYLLGRVGFYLYLPLESFFENILFYYWKEKDLGWLSWSYLYILLLPKYILQGQGFLRIYRLEGNKRRFGAVLYEHFVRIPVINWSYAGGWRLVYYWEDVEKEVELSGWLRLFQRKFRRQITLYEASRRRLRRYALLLFTPQGRHVLGWRYRLRRVARRSRGRRLKLYGVLSLHSLRLRWKLFRADLLFALKVAGKTLRKYPLQCAYLSFRCIPLGLLSICWGLLAPLSARLPPGAFPRAMGLRFLSSIARKRNKR